MNRRITKGPPTIREKLPDINAEMDKQVNKATGGEETFLMEGKAIVKNLR